MNITLSVIQGLTFFVFFFYVFLDTRIYLALWAAIFSLISMSIKYYFVVNAGIYKGIIAAYVVVILVGYLVRFRRTLLSGKNMNDGKLSVFSLDPKRQKRVGIATLLLILVNVALIICK